MAAALEKKDCGQSALVDAVKRGLEADQAVPLPER